MNYIRNNYRIWIGIDTGTNTGVAVWDRKEKKMVLVETMMIHKAFELVQNIAIDNPGLVFVRFEDARLRTWLGADKGRAQLQGAGSIKRDCSAWEDFLKDKGIPYSSDAPRKGMTKWSTQEFKQATGWTGITSHHSRDAALLVYGL